MQWHTELKTQERLDRPASDHFYVLGSCFAEFLFERIKELRLNISGFPCGISYNPVSIARSLEILTAGQGFQESDFFINPQSLYCHFDLHSDFSNIDLNLALQTANIAQREQRNFLTTPATFIITLGTSYGYFLNDDNRIVNNCHKQPADFFSRRIISIAEIISALDSIVSHAEQLSGTRFIFTVSPVRHFRDSFVENSRSKAQLICALHEFISTKSNCHYFPAFEIMMDDLREYRFYDSTGTHPNRIAQDYIWDKFVEYYFSSPAKSYIEKSSDLVKMYQHKIIHPETPSSRAFVNKREQRRQELANEHSYSLWSNESQ